MKRSNLQSKSTLRPGKKCKTCKGTGDVMVEKHITDCQDCKGKGFIIKPKRKSYIKTKPKSKRHAISLEYTAKRKRFMLLNPRCQVLKPNGRPCGKPSTDCHHRKGRNSFMLDETTWLSTCSDCHREIHTTHQTWARSMGYLLNPASKEEVSPPSKIFIPYENQEKDQSS